MLTSFIVKQEILMSDVQTCFSALKKAVHDFQTMAMTSAAQLQMGQPNARYVLTFYRLARENS